MQVIQKVLKLKPYPKGFHIITSEVESICKSTSIKNGTMNLFLQHTSASLTINENCDPSVRKDMENYLSDSIDDKPYYIHTYEGYDDMPAHIKSSLFGQSVTLPITNSKLNLGTWQGIYFGEHREHASGRTIIITIIGE